MCPPIKSFAFSRYLSGNLSDSRVFSASALHSQLGLVIVGGSPPLRSTADATADGVVVDSESVPDFFEGVCCSCMVDVGNGTLMSFGGAPSSNHRRVARLTAGSGQWEESAEFQFLPVSKTPVYK